MKTARVTSGAIVAYPYLLRPTAKQAHPEVSPLPGTWEQCTPEQLAALECVLVQDVERPDNAREGTPVLVDGQWRQNWVVQPAYDPATHTCAWDGAQWVVTPIPFSEIQAQIGSAVQTMIDGVCTGGVPYFRDIFSARGYVGDPNPAYHARAVALRDWSSSVWTALDVIQSDVMAGNRPLPTVAELLAELPQAPG